MASFIEKADAAVHGLTRLYGFSETATERVLNHVLMATLDTITNEMGASVDSVYPTLIKLMNAKECISSMPGQQTEHSELFRRLWGVNK